MSAQSSFGPTQSLPVPAPQPAPSRLPVPPLVPGARIAVIAPAGSFDAAAFEAGVARLRTRYEVSFRDDVLARKAYFAGDDARRFVELEAALADRDVRAIVAARGGYGSARLLEWLPPANVRDANKLLVGFSDLTALHALWARAGLRSLHAPMVCALGSAHGAASAAASGAASAAASGAASAAANGAASAAASGAAHREARSAASGDALFARWIAAVEGAAPSALHGLRAVSASRAQAVGPLVGGNLAVLVSLLGTAYFPPVDGAVLFLEDVGERPYRVDRMLTQLRHAGVLARVAAVVLGAFTDAPPGRDGTSVDDVLAACLAELPVPVLHGVPAGHIDDNLELPLGARVRVDAGAGSLHFDEGIA